jgi:chloramphenicol-sensitive protein RarD
MPASRLAGFALVWIALIVFTTDALRRSRIVPTGEPGGDAPVLPAPAAVEARS